MVFPVIYFLRGEITRDENLKTLLTDLSQDHVGIMQIVQQQTGLKYPSDQIGIFDDGTDPTGSFLMIILQFGKVTAVNVTNPERSFYDFFKS